MNDNPNQLVQDTFSAIHDLLKPLGRESMLRVVGALSTLYLEGPVDQELYAQIKSLRAENEQLRDWKDQMMRVESEWDEQALAKKLGGVPGQSCREAITAGVDALLDENRRLRKELNKAHAELDSIKQPQAYAPEVIHEGGEVFPVVDTSAPLPDDPRK